MARGLIIIGLILVIIGLLWPWLQKTNIGRLPGDFIIEKENMKFYFPIVSSVIISIILSVLFWIFKK